MTPLSFVQIAQMAQGELKSQHSQRCINRVCTDSRKVKPGDLFVALQGEKFDGHDYLKEVHEKGALLALISKEQEKKAIKSGVSYVLVEDTLIGLQTLAKSYRKTLQTKIIGITGSNGKTSTKELVASILAQKYSTSKTAGNLNNHIGVPLTVLSLKQDCEMAVIEMGMNHEGEIALLADIALPDFCVITCVGWAHIEFFEDKDAIAREKGALVRALPEKGICILNGDDARVAAMSQTTKAKCVTAGSKDNVDYKFSNVLWEQTGTSFKCQGPKAEYTFRINYPGWHMLQNASLAAALGFELGLNEEEIKVGLEECKIPGGRLKIEPFHQGWLIDDSYNANPDSMLAAFKTMQFLNTEGRSIAFLGPMAELGSYTEELHKQVGRDAVKEGIQCVFSTGRKGDLYIESALHEGIPSNRAQFFDDHTSMVEAYRDIARDNDIVLVKGSRAAQMEKVVNELKRI